MGRDGEYKFNYGREVQWLGCRQASEKQGRGKNNFAIAQFF